MIDCGLKLTIGRASEPMTRAFKRKGSQSSVEIPLPHRKQDFDPFLSQTSESSLAEMVLTATIPVEAHHYLE